MEIKTYDIGRADCILLREETSIILLDCGVGRQKRVQLKDINQDINIAQNRSMVITHFHLDHYRGLKYIAHNKFDKIYLNSFLLLFYSKANIKLLVKLFQIYFFITGAHQLPKGVYFILDYLYFCAINLNSTSFGIQFVNSGDKIRDFKDHIDVIWPDFRGINNSFAQIEEALDSFCKTNEIDLEKTSMNLSKRFENALYELYDKIFSKISNESNKRLSNENLQSKEVKEIHKIMVIANQNKEEVDASPNSYQELNGRLRSLLNDISLVIKNEKVAFFGDVSPRTIWALCHLGRLNNDFFLIKTPHHGSDTHFSPLLNPCAIFLSCSNNRKKDINNRNSYLAHYPCSFHVFSNGDVFYRLHIHHNLLNAPIIFNI